MKLLGDIHERNAWLSSDKPAVVFGDAVQTFKEHWHRINKLADGLYRQGVRHQDRVALLAMNRLEYIEVYGACERAGFVMTTVNFRLAPAEILYILTDSAPHTLIFEDQYAEVIDSLRSSLDIRRYVCLGAPVPWAESYEAVVASGSLDGPPMHAAPDDDALIMYTSGTTGRPKGVVRSQRGEARLADVMAGQLKTGGDTRQLLMMPFFHAGSRSQYIASFWTGGAVHMHRAYDPALIMQTIQACRITHTHLAPTMVQGIIDLPDVAAYDVSSVRVILYAAAPMPVSLLKRGFGSFRARFR